MSYPPSVCIQKLNFLQLLPPSPTLAPPSFSAPLLLGTCQVPETMPRYLLSTALMWRLRFTCDRVEARSVYNCKHESQPKKRHFCLGCLAVAFLTPIALWPTLSRRAVFICQVLGTCKSPQVQLWAARQLDQDPATICSPQAKTPAWQKRNQGNCRLPLGSSTEAATAVKEKPRNMRHRVQDLLKPSTLEQCHVNVMHTGFSCACNPFEGEVNTCTELAFMPGEVRRLVRPSGFSISKIKEPQPSPCFSPRAGLEGLHKLECHCRCCNLASSDRKLPTSAGRTTSRVILLFCSSVPELD